MDRRFNQTTRHSKESVRSYISKQAIIRVGWANLFSGVCKVQVRILPDLINPKAKEVKV
jgi:hypothetical protein